MGLDMIKFIHRYFWSVYLAMGAVALVGLSLWR
jgi:hypothetical protein